MLIEIHILQNHSPSNLNRDDTGSPKECTFGGARRARISSQCLKRTIRRSDIFRQALEGHLATRTRRLPVLVRDRLKAAGIAEDVANVAAKKASGFGTSEGKEREANKNTGEFETAQTMFLTDADVEAVVGVLLAAAQKAGSVKALEAIKAKDLQAEARAKGFRPISVDVALFGRMTTSEAFRDVEAACQVAHALSTHKVDHEFDYFTAVDDLQGKGEQEEDAGADMIGDVEFNSACYYKYVSIDASGLVDNLTGKAIFRNDQTDRVAATTLAAEAVAALVRAAVMTTPTGKQNTFAAHQLPAAVLVEVRPHPTPVSYANAFVEPVRPFSKADGDLVSSSLGKLASHVEALTTGFNLETSARLLLAPEHPQFAIADVERVADLNALCGRLKNTVAAGG